MGNLDNIITVLNATILSTKSSVTLEQCNRDYRELEGEWIPHRKLGFKTLEDLFYSLPGFRLIKQPNGACIVEAKQSSEIKHVTDLVSKQVVKSKKSRYHLQRPIRNLISGSSWKPNSSWGYNNKPFLKAPIPYNKPKIQETIPKKQAIIQTKLRVVKPAPVQENNPPPPQLKSILKVPLTANSNTILPILTQSQSPIKTNTTPTSKLSGIKPGDLLARSQSNPVMTNNNSGSKDYNSGSKDYNSGSKDYKRTVSVSGSSVINNGKLSAANRLTTLQNTLQATDSDFNLSIIVRNKEANTVVAPSPVELTRQNSLDTVLRELTNNKTRLLKCCHMLNLPEPIFKSVSLINRREKLFDCTVKIGNVYSFTTYPNSKATEEQAVEAASKIGIDNLKQIIEKDSYPVSKTMVAIPRIVTIVASHPCGLWANTLPDIYKTEYKEYLPENWLELIDEIPNVTKENGMNDMIMLLPVSNVSEPPILQSTENDIPKRTIGPPTLHFPSDSLWNVFVMSAYSTVEVWMRIIGEDYSDAFETLITDMEMYYLENRKRSKKILQGGWYALNIDESWLRVRVLEIDEQNRRALCFLVDNGDEESYPLEAFYDLPKQFLCVPPQAILCRLAGLEEYALVGEVGNDRTFLSDALVGKVLVAEVLQLPDENHEDPTVVLFDTSTDVDVNINKELLRMFTQRASPPELPSGVSEVYVMDVTTSGKICVQIHSESWKLLQNMLHQISSGPFPIESLQASFGEIVPTPTVRYLVKSLSGEWRRGVLRSGVIEDQTGVKCVSVRYLDCGRTESVPVSDLVVLERVSDALHHFPPQALYLTLFNVGTLNWDQMNKINSLVPRNSPVLCRPIILGSTVVELFVRTQPHNVLCSVNNALILEEELSEKLKLNDLSAVDPQVALNKKKERLFANKNSFTPEVKKDQLSSIIPQKGEYFDVMVSLASNPRNFVVQPLQRLQELGDLMSDMQSVCEELPPKSISFSKQKMYAVYQEKDKQWYRTSFQGMPSKDSPSMYFIDYGDYYSTSVDNIRELPLKFTVLPPMAIKAKLYGVRPKDQDWSVDDCVRFIRLVNEQSFASVVKDIEEDPMGESEPLLVLDLIDTSTHEDLYVNALLVRENRAIPV